MGKSFRVSSKTFEATLGNAMQYNEAGLAEEWLRTYYVKRFGENAYPEHWILDGLVKIPLRLVSEEVEKQEVSCTTGDAGNAVPLLFRYQNGKFILMGDNDCLQQLKENRINSYPAYIFVVNREEYPSYVMKYGKPFHQAKI